MMNSRSGNHARTRIAAPAIVRCKNSPSCSRLLGSPDSRPIRLATYAIIDESKRLCGQSKSCKPPALRGLIAANFRGTHVTLADGAPGHVEHPLERYSRLLHHLIRQLDSRLEVTQ